MNRPVGCVAFLSALAVGGHVDAREVWHEVESANFVVVSNATEARAADIAARMERFRYALSRLLPGSSFATEVPTQVYAFRDRDGLESFLPLTDEGLTPAGYFRGGPYKNVIVIDLSAGRAAYERVVWHEYVHLMLSLSPGDFPLWFEEGMAEFYSSTRLDEDGGELGVVEERHRRRLVERTPLPLAEILAASHDWLSTAAAEETALFYAQSWALVHYLVAGTGADGHRKLASYLDRSSRGEDLIETFRDVFAMTPEEMSATLVAYVDGGELAHYRLSLSGIDWHDRVLTRTLAEAEVHHRLGELLLFTDRTEQARSRLDEASRLNPDLTVVWETRGIAALMAGRHEEALDHLTRAVSYDDAGPSTLYLYARALLHEHSGHWVRDIPEDIADEAEWALTRSLQMKPSQSESARLLAFVYLVRDVRLQRAAALIESALAMTPGRPSLLYLYGQLLARRGDYEGARAALREMRSEAIDPSLSAAADELLERLDADERAP